MLLDVVQDKLNIPDTQRNLSVYDWRRTITNCDPCECCSTTGKMVHRLFWLARGEGGGWCFLNEQPTIAVRPGYTSTKKRWQNIEWQKNGGHTSAKNIISELFHLWDGKWNCRFINSAAVLRSRKNLEAWTTDIVCQIIRFFPLC